MTEEESMDANIELVNPSESDRWTAIRFSDGDFRPGSGMVALRRSSVRS